MKYNILIGSPVYQSPDVLRHFLNSLSKINYSIHNVDINLIDDNHSKESSLLLENFAKDNKNVTITDGWIKTEKYENHNWKNDIVWKVACYKNKLMEIVLEKNYDYLFLLDSDLIIDPNLLLHLIDRKKDIVCEIFWTSWQPNAILMPNVWITDLYTMYNTDKCITDQQKNDAQNDFINMLKTPGIYEVGGLGACTLFSNNSIKMGVNFKKIDNISTWGEDRHLCVRANVLGITLWADTVYPPYHMYTKKDIPKILDQKILLDKQELLKPNKIVVGMCFKNEENFIKNSLEDIKKYADHIVLVDDGSNDNTSEICKKILLDVSYEIIRNEISLFHTEHLLRKQLWNEIIKNEPTWIIILDADEIFEERFSNEIRTHLNKQNDLFSFRLYDMWDETHYRDDNLWKAHNAYRPFMIKYDCNFNYIWKETNQHCGRFPCNIYKGKNINLEYKLKHYGWYTKDIRIKKYFRYMKLDPQGKYGNINQYQSILDKNPTIKLF